MSSPNNNLLIIGAGQYGLVAREIALAMGNFGEIAFLDDSFSSVMGSQCLPGAEGNRGQDCSPHIIGATGDIEKFAAKFRYGFVAIGNPQIRRKFIEMLCSKSITPAILVHPTAYVSPSAQIQEGCCIEPLAVVQTEAIVAISSFVASGAVIRHNAFVSDFCHIDCNAVVESTAIVPVATKVACNSVFRKGQNF